VAFDLGSLRRELGDHAGAIEPLTRAVRNGRDGWRAHFNLAGALTSLDRLDEALEQYRLARGARDYGGYYAEMREVEVLVAAKRPTEAVALVMTILDGPFAAQAVQNHQLLTAASIALSSGGDPVKGERWARQAVAVAPDEVRGHSALALALALLGRREEAEAALERARAIDPTWRHLRVVEAALGR
jgi:Flp pilus assembly protein TadD